MNNWSKCVQKVENYEHTPRLWPRSREAPMWSACNLWMWRMNILWPCSRREQQNLTWHQWWPGTHRSRCFLSIRYKSNPRQVSEEPPGTSLTERLSMWGQSIRIDSFSTLTWLVETSSFPISKVICGVDECNVKSQSFWCSILGSDSWPPPPFSLTEKEF